MSKNNRNKEVTENEQVVGVEEMASRLAENEIAYTDTDTVETVQGEVEPQKVSILEKVQQAMTIDPNSHFQTVPGKDGTTTEIVKKQYSFIEPIGKRSQISVYDVDIITSLDKIQSAITGKKYLNYIMAKEFSNINESGKLENMGFKNIAELGKAVFGLESSTVNHYTRIGKFFLESDYSVKAGLPELSVSHFLELSKLVDEESGDISAITNLYITGTLTDGMSTKKIREIVNQLTIEDKGEENKTEEEKQEESKEEQADATATKITEETPVETLSADFDKQVVVGQIVNSVTRINDLFSLLKQNNIETTGYNEALELLQNLALQLLQ